MMRSCGSTSEKHGWPRRSSYRVPRGVRVAGRSINERCRRCGADEWKERGTHRYCAPCDRNRAKTNRKAARKADPAKTLLSLAKQRAAKAGQPFGLTIDDVRAAWPEDNRCPVFGTEFIAGTRKQSDQSPSIDRLDNRWPYVLGNIAIISARANRLKRDGTAAELEQIAAWMRSRGLS